jgi:hypothetical protein
MSELVQTNGEKEPKEEAEDEEEEEGGATDLSNRWVVSLVLIVCFDQADALHFEKYRS